MKIKVNKTEINKIAKELLRKALEIKTTKAMVIAMSGDLGTGKTTLTQEISKELGVKDSVISPTFVIMKIYETSPKEKILKKIKKLIHIDAYRLEGATELEKIGWKSFCDNKENLIIVEWPENVKDCLPKESLYVQIKHLDEDNRILEF